MATESSIGDTQCLELLREAHVAVAIAMLSANPEWMDLWKRIHAHLERRDAGTRTRWEQAEIYLGRLSPLLENHEAAEAELATLIGNLEHHDNAYWKIESDS